TPEASVPGPQWGITQVCVVQRRASALPPMPGKIVPIETIRPPLPKPKTAGDYHSIEVIGQLRVSAEQFGRHFWHLVNTKVPNLRSRLECTPLKTIEYSDRYLRTPLTMRLLVETLRTLKAEYPGAFTSSTKIIVNTT